MFTASCLCRAVQFNIHGELAPIQVCHCGKCRKAQGGPIVTVIPVNESAIEWIAGRESLKAFESSPGKERVFCANCGAPVFSRRTGQSDGQPGVLRIRAGLIDGDLPVQPVSHAFVGEACNWWPIDDELPKYDGARPAGAP